MFEQGQRRIGPIVHRSGRSMATLVSSAAGVVLAAMAWTSAGSLRGATAGPEAQGQPPPKAADKGFITPPPTKAPSIVRAERRQAGHCSTWKTPSPEPS